MKAMRSKIELTAGPDDGPHHHENCDCRTCRRRAAMLGEGIVPRVDAVTAKSWPNPDDHGTPPRHPHTGRFMAPAHPDHDGRDTKGRYLSPADEVDGWPLHEMR